MRVAFSGTRNGCDPRLIREVLWELNPAEDRILQGGARGVDAIVFEEALAQGFTVETFKANWEKYGKAAGNIRNEKMIRTAERLYAFWDGRTEHCGTLNAVAFARKCGMPTFVCHIGVGFLTEEDLKCLRI